MEAMTEDEEESYCSEYEYEYLDEDDGRDVEDFTTRSDRILAAFKDEKPTSANFKTTGMEDDDDDDNQRVGMSIETTTASDAHALMCPKCLAEEHQPVQDCQRVATWTSKRNQIPTVDPVFIKACLEQFIRRAATELGIHRDAAEALCRRYRWDLDAIEASRDPLYERARLVHNGQNQGGDDDDDNDENNDNSEDVSNDAMQVADDQGKDSSQRRSKRPKESPPKNITCPVCFDDHAESDMMALSSCQHAFCHACWHNYLRAHLEEGQIAGLVCPAVGCTETVLSRHIQQVAADLLPLLEDIQLRSFIANEETLCWCPGCILRNHPNPHVAVYPRNLFLEHGGYGFVCTACQSCFCFHCHDPPHDGPCKFRNRNQGAPEGRPAFELGNELKEVERVAQVAPEGELIQAAEVARAEEMVRTADRLEPVIEAAGVNVPVAPASPMAPIGLDEGAGQTGNWKLSDYAGVIAVPPVAGNSSRGSGGNGGTQEHAGNLEEWQNAALGVEIRERRAGASAPVWAARRGTDSVARREARYAERRRGMAAIGADRQLKRCPRCTVDIEKIGGCNRMTCRCGHHFCWHCLEDYSAYGSHFCGRPDANRGIQGRRGRRLVNLDFLRHTLYKLATDTSFNTIEEDVQKRVVLQEQLEELERFAHFYNRYHAHEEGQRFCERQCPCLEGRADDYVQMAGIYSGTDVDFIQQANEMLVASRRMLKYAYCAAYYHYVDQEDSASEDGSEEKNTSNFCGETHAHLGFLQLERLERFTEELSGVSENALTRRDRSRVIDLIAVVSKSMEAVADFETFS